MDCQGLTAEGSAVSRVARACTRWLLAFDGNVLGAWRERALVRRTSRESLRLYRLIERTRPELTGELVYRELVARQAGLDVRDARTMVSRAQSSFASWPVERPLRLRDVVLYLAVVRCLDADPVKLGIRSRVTTIVAAEIPENL